MSRSPLAPKKGRAKGPRTCDDAEKKWLAKNEKKNEKRNSSVSRYPLSFIDCDSVSFLARRTGKSVVHAMHLDVLRVLRCSFLLNASETAGVFAMLRPKWLAGPDRVAVSLATSIVWRR